MKHIFLIHSHALLLTALGVTARENIHKEDVIFIYSRNYKNVLPIDFIFFDFSTEIEDTFYIMLSWSRRHFLLDKENRNRSVYFFDKFIAENAAVGYYLYVCQLQAYTNQILATNSLCQECFFIQEGGRVMFPLLTDHISWFCRLYNAIVLKGEKRLWKMSNWFPNKKTPYNRPIIAYAFDKSYFGNMPQEIRIVKWPKVNLDISIDISRPIFVLEGAVELGQVESPLYEKAVKKLVSEFASEKNYIKFHPKNGDIAKEKYKSFFYDKKVEIEELPMDIPFELILTNFDSLKLYGSGTSLLFYGKALGHQVISREEYLLSSVRYRTYVKGLQILDCVSIMRK